LSLATGSARDRALVLLHLGQQFTLARRSGPHADIGRIFDQRAVFRLLGVDLHRDRLVADVLGFIDSLGRSQRGAGFVVERERVAHRAPPRTLGEQFRDLSGTFRAGVGVSLPFRAVFCGARFPSEMQEVSISRAFPACIDVERFCGMDAARICCAKYPCADSCRNCLALN
jgi:hypothetical protein